MSSSSIKVIEEPTLRVRRLFQVGSDIEIDENIPPRRYFRSGYEMIRMATVYWDEGNLESAYILFSKFITLFVEKLPQHPDYKTTPAAEKARIKKKLVDAFPVAEAIKAKLSDGYKKEYELYLKQKAEEEKLEAERRKREAEERRRKEEQRRLEEEKQLQLQSALEKLKLSTDVQPVASEVPPQLENISYDWPKANVTPIPQPTDQIPFAELKPNSIPDNSRSIPSVDRSVKPASLLSHIVEESGSKLRTVIVPVSLMAKFLALAQPNTNRKVETCGILTGKLAKNKFTITHLIVPKQRGTSDSCATENEEEIFEIQDQYDLVTLGWIHTHPTQTSFMSSVDLHTHCSYQLMLQEAIAIVCSPKFDDDYGLNYIANCRQPGFHPHPKEPPLFYESSHVELDYVSPIEVVDLR
ncbi:hypothetical protein CHUAL_001197 [Chamberlinius hualienensis]